MPALVQQTAQLLAFPGHGVSLRSALTQALKYHRLPEQLMEAFLREASAFSGCGIDEALTRVLAARMRPAPIDLSRSNRIFLIGPSGAGRSAVAAKLVQAAALAGHNQLVVIDSQGFNPRNLRARAAFGCVGARRDMEAIGVVSALADAEEISETIATFHLTRLIVTGLDMAGRCGALVAAVTQGASLAHVSRSPDADAPLESLSPRELANLLLN
jgi:flagellar biosynthesis protein FlhF